MHVSLLIAAVSCAYLVAGRSTATNPGQTDPASSTHTATATTASQASTTSTSDSAPTTSAAAAETEAHGQSASASTIEAAPEPIVLECLIGTPGPARWSDGITRFSQWCFDELDGDGYLRSEREANTFECDGTTCRNPYNGMSYPDPASVVQTPVGTTSTRGYSCTPDSCYWPDGSFVIGADRCGIACGEPPTSGDIQTRSGCEAGYITDPLLCGY